MLLFVSHDFIFYLYSYLLCFFDCSLSLQFFYKLSVLFNILLSILISTATDEVICQFLRTRCYPSSQSQSLLGPLSRQLSIFSPFFQMVPLDESKPTSLPRCLETLNEELIDSMSMNLLCSIM